MYMYVLAMSCTKTINSIVIMNYAKILIMNQTHTHTQYIHTYIHDMHTYTDINMYIHYIKVTSVLLYNDSVYQQQVVAHFQKSYIYNYNTTSN